MIDHDLANKTTEPEPSEMDREKQERDNMIIERVRFRL